MKYIISLDIGTTSVKAGLFDRYLKAYNFASVEYELLTPKNDYVELDPLVYWISVKDAIKELLEKNCVDRKDIEAIALCSQGETLIPIDKEGKHLHNAIVWIDSRARKEAEYLSNIIGNDNYYSTTGLSECNPADPVCKLMWIKHNCPDVYKNTYKFLLLTDYIAYILSGKITAEWTMMCSTGYYDINNYKVWDEILTAAGIDTDKIPNVERSGVITGDINPEKAEQLNLPKEVKIVISANDQMCGAVGGGNIESGTVTETTGTALVITATVDKPDYNNKQRIVFYKHVNEKYLTAPYVNTASIILKWFKDEFCAGEVSMAQQQDVSVYELLGSLAAEVPVLANGLMLYPQFAGKNSPGTNANARGAFINVGLEAKRGHFIRAIFEGIAYMLKENILALEEIGIDVKEVRSLGGGAKSEIWNQIKADVLDKEIITLKSEEAASLGVAIVAAVSIGWFESLEQASEVVIKPVKRFRPNKENVKKYKKGFDFYMKMEKVLTELFEDKFYI